ncbi:MAG: exodeoxyribonuclease VII small subunit [Caldilineaceae bacterium]
MSVVTEIPATPVQELSYEEALAQLETILDALEQDDLPLESSLTLYERGVLLADYCTNLLDAAELRVRKWQADGQTTPFDDWQEG